MGFRHSQSKGEEEAQWAFAHTLNFSLLVGWLGSSYTSNRKEIQDGRKEVEEADSGGEAFSYHTHTGNQIKEMVQNSTKY